MAEPNITGPNVTGPDVTELGAVELGAVELGAVELDRRVLEAIAPILARVRPGHLSLPTPCDGWTLGDLLRHMVGHHRGFAAAARGAQPDPGVWDDATLGDDPAGTYREAAALVTAAFAEDGLIRRRLAVHVYGTFGARTALNMHSVDFLGHGWDVARALGSEGDDGSAPESLVRERFDDALCLAGLAIAGRWPDTPATWGTGPSSPFRPRVPVPADAPAYQRLMGLLGRDPQWTPES
jgi:uncharacterized protein (TIGR03086 family)